MNERQRRTITALRNRITRFHKVRSEEVHTFEFGRRIVYEIEYGSSNILGQHHVIYSIGPRGGIRNEQRVY